VDGRLGWYKKLTFDGTIRAELKMNGERKALIFDMDGVIVDSDPLHLKAYQTVLATFQIAYSEDDSRQFLGRKDSDCAAALVEMFDLPLKSLDLLEKKLAITAQLLRTEARSQPGIIDALQKAMDLGLPCGIASSAAPSTIKLVLDALKLEPFFQSVTSGEEVLHGKPAPDIFLKAAERLNADVRSCLVIEDSLNGIKAAKAAGMKCVSVPCNTTRYQDHAEADIRLESIAQLDLANWLQTGHLRRA
jgi:beta-phosphoglucomutase family hydrolase